MNQIHSVTYSGKLIDDPTGNPDDPYDDTWLFLEQEWFPPVKQHADFTDIYNMWVRARSGLSAQSWVSEVCPITVEEADDGSLKVPLEFYVFVPYDNFEYELETNVAEEFDENVFIKGDIQDDGVGYVRKGYSTAFTMTDQLVFNHRLADLHYYWESAVYNTWGEVIQYGSAGGFSTIGKAVDLDWLKEQIEAGVTVTMNPATLRARGRYITAGDNIFGVVRLNYRAIAKLHKLNLYIQPQANADFQNIRPTIIAKWDVEGVTKTTTLTLDIPQCVYDQIKQCGGISTLALIYSGKRYIIYYSTCDGSFLAAREVGSLNKDAYYKAEQ